MEKLCRSEKNYIPTLTVDHAWIFIVWQQCALQRKWMKWKMTWKILFEALYYLFIYCIINQHCLNNHYLCVRFFFLQSFSLLVSFVVCKRMWCSFHLFLKQTTQIQDRIIILIHELLHIQCFNGIIMIPTRLCAGIWRCHLLVAGLIQHFVENA